MAKSSLIPGFRFHPTDVELVMYYLKRKLLGKKIIVNAVAEVNIYDFSPWDLPDKSSLKSGDLEWYFFCPKAKKYLSGFRSNRATNTGFWKATGKDRKVKYKDRSVATIKTLVFHIGHAGNGQRTDWVMHEYKMEDEQLANAGIVQDMYVLCKVFEKSGSGPKNGAQYGAPFNEEEWDEDVTICSGSGAVVCQDEGATNCLDLKQKGPAITEPGSSTVTFSLNEMAANALNINKQEDPSTITEPGPSTVTFSLNETEANALNVDKQEDPSTITEPGPSSVTFYTNDDDDVMLMEDIASIMKEDPKDLNINNKEKGVEATNSEKGKGMAINADDGIFDDLVNLIDLEDLNGDKYTLDKIFSTDDLDVELGGFYVD